MYKNSKDIKNYGMHSQGNMTPAMNKLSFLNFITHSIRVKLMMSFFIPVVCIVILGLVAYSYASKSIVSTFTDSINNVVSSTANYYEVIMKTVEDKINQLSSDPNTWNYYSKLLQSDIVKESEVYKEIRNSVKTMATSDKYIGNIAIFTNYGQPAVSTHETFSVSNPFETFKTTDEATYINNSSSSLVWAGYHNFIDEQLRIMPKDYAIAVTKKYKNKSGQHIGFIQMDLKMKAVADTLSSLQLPEGSLVAFISGDGREITGSGAAEEPLFTNHTYYLTAINTE